MCEIVDLKKTEETVEKETQEMLWENLEENDVAEN
jgi:hypothetical protein